MYLLKMTVLLSVLIITAWTDCALPTLEKTTTEEQSPEPITETLTIKNAVCLTTWGLGLGSLASYYSWQKGCACVHAARNSNISGTVENCLRATIAPAIVGGLTHWATTTETSPEYKLFVITLFSGFAFTSGLMASKTYHHPKQN